MQIIEEEKEKEKVHTSTCALKKRAPELSKGWGQIVPTPFRSDGRRQTKGELRMSPERLVKEFLCYSTRVIKINFSK